MDYRFVRHQPPQGSTAWGAQQFLRLLDDEERIAAERERLRATGWRPALAARRAQAYPASQEDVLRNVVPDPHDRAESVRRASFAPRHRPSSASAPPAVLQASQTGDGFDWYKLYCALDPQACLLGQIFRGDATGSGGSCPEPDCARIRQECHEECIPISLGNRSDSPLLHRRCVRECMADQGCFDY